MRWALAMVAVVASCDPAPPRVPPVDNRLEEPSREAFLGVEFLTYFEHEARTTSPLIVALHGDEPPESFAAMWRSFPARVEIAIPRVPGRHDAPWFDWAPGMTDEALAEATSRAEATLWPAIAALARGRQILLAGFSQGAVLAYAMAAHHPDEIACAFPIGGALPARLWPHGRSAPVYALSGAEDPRVGAARETIAAFAATGAAELREIAGAGHTISPAMRDDLVTQVRAVAANLERYPRREARMATSLFVAPAATAP